MVEYDLSVAYDVSTAVYAGAGEAFSVRAQEESPVGMAFDNSGTKMFVIGDTDDAVVAYDLVPTFDSYTEVAANDGTMATNTTPFFYTVRNGTFLDADNDDLLDTGFTVANLPAGLVANFVLSDGDTVATLELSGTATAHDVADSVPDLGVSLDSATSMTVGTAKVNCNATVDIDFLANPVISCSAPYDVSGAIHAGAGEEFPVAAQETVATGVTFNGDGTKMFIIGFIDDAVVAYDLGTPYDVSTAVYAGEEFSVRTEEDDAEGIAFNGDGTKMFVIGTTDKAIVEYDLGTAYDISTAVHAGAGEEFVVGAEESVPTDMVFNGDGSKMFVVGSNGGAVVEYDLGTAYDVSTAVYNGAGEELQIIAQEANPSGMAFNHDGTLLFVIGHTLGMVMEYRLTTPYDVSTASYAGDVERFSVVAQAPYPTGMAFNGNGTKMFVIGATNNVVVEYDLGPAYNNYTEVAANDGNIAPNTAPLFYTVTNGTFLDADNDDLLDAGFTVAHLPAGLVAQFALSDGDTVATLELLGTATAHDVTDGVPDLGVSFDSTASMTVGTATVKCVAKVGVDFLADPIIICGTRYDASTAVHAGTGEEFSVATEEGNPTGMVFNNDGSKLFIIGNDGDAVVEYDLSTPYDVSTAMYAGAGEEFSVRTEEITPRGMAFKR